MLRMALVFVVVSIVLLATTGPVHAAYLEGLRQVILWSAHAAEGLGAIDGRMLRVLQRNFMTADLHQTPLHPLFLTHITYLALSVATPRVPIRARLWSVGLGMGVIVLFHCLVYVPLLITMIATRSSWLRTLLRVLDSAGILVVPFLLWWLAIYRRTPGLLRRAA